MVHQVIDSRANAGVAHDQYKRSGFGFLRLNHSRSNGESGKIQNVQQDSGAPDWG
jgi:hypothetical protein|tara:strand:+ start:64 stop:228 length:165 start_codon:yes stop_codon:yes gene_type:complete